VLPWAGSTKSQLISCFARLHSQGVYAKLHRALKHYLQHSAVLLHQYEMRFLQQDLRFNSHAICALQEASEAYIVDLFEVNASIRDIVLPD
jgi:hypothetical protein